MPRNASGTYTLPLPPVVPDTTIESVWANTSLDDIAASITDSLDRYGRGGMVAPFRLVDGTAAQPALSFTAETGSGLFRESAGVVAWSIAGTKIGNWSAAGLTVTPGKVLTAETGVFGTGTPSGGLQLRSTNKLSFTDTVGQTYIHAPESNTVALGTAGVERMRITSDGKVGFGAPPDHARMVIKGNGTFGVPYNQNEFQILDPAGLNDPNFGFFINQQYDNATTGKFTIGANNSNNHTFTLAFSTANVERMSIGLTGNVSLSQSLQFAPASNADYRGAIWLDTGGTKWASIEGSKNPGPGGSELSFSSGIAGGGDANNGFMTFLTSAALRMIIQADGTVNMFKAFAPAYTRWYLKSIADGHAFTDVDCGPGAHARLIGSGTINTTIPNGAITPGNILYLCIYSFALTTNINWAGPVQVFDANTGGTLPSPLVISGVGSYRFICIESNTYVFHRS